MKAELVLGNLKREREGIDSKLTRLHNALCKEWQDENQEYLCTQQYNAMCLYAHILDERILDIEYKLTQKKKNQSQSDIDDDNIFNKKIDPKEYKKCANNAHLNTDKLGEDENPEEIIIGIIKTVFGEDIFDETK